MHRSELKNSNTYMLGKKQEILKSGFWDHTDDFPASRLSSATEQVRMQRSRTNVRKITNEKVTTSNFSMWIRSKGFQTIRKT